MKTEYVHYLYYTLLYILYALYIITILNLAYFKSVTAYLPFIQDGLKYFVILFLLIRFNPYTNEKFTELALAALGGRDMEEIHKYNDKIMKNVLKEVILSREP